MISLAANRFIANLLLSLCCLVVLFRPDIAHAQGGSGATSSGTDFWLGFTPSVVTVQPILFVTGDTATTGTVTIPGLSFSQEFTVTPGTATTITLPTAAVVSSNETIEDLGVHVVAGANVSVYGLDYFPAGTDGYLGLPVAADGTDYIVLAYNSFPPGFQGGARSQYLIVATADATTVTITPSASDIDCVATTLTLNVGQTYRHRACSTEDADVTGTRISSDKPIAVYGGHECTNIPNSGFVACNQVVEQMTPTSSWGTRFLTVPFAERTGGDQFRILASTAGTEVRIDGALVATLDAGAFFQTALTASSLIETTLPVLVAQYSNSATFDGNSFNADSSEMLVPPLEQYLASYTVTTPDDTTDIVANFINVIVPTPAIGTTTLDGTAIAAESFTPIGSSGFSGAQLTVSIGSHTLSGPLPFGIFVYGYGSFDNYSYTGGFSVSPIALVTSVALTPESASKLVGAEHCVTVAVLDQDDAPLEGIRIDFTVAGANPGSGFQFTDAEGNGEFCYIGANAGTDTITGTVGALSDSGSVTFVTDPPTVTIGIAPTSIVLGQTATLTFSSTFAESCTASGAWTGSRPTSGSQIVTPTTTGTLSYSLSCTGPGGTASSSVSLIVNEPPVVTVSGKGGAFGWSPLLLLALGGLLRRLRRAKQLASHAVIGSTLVAATVLPAAAQADTFADKLYAGIRFGRMHLDIDSSDLTNDLRAQGFSTALVKVDKHSVAGTVYAGYEVLPKTDLELSYTYSDSVQATISGGPVPTQPLLEAAATTFTGYGDIVALSVRKHLELGHGFTLNPRIGGYYWDSKVRASASGVTVSHTQSGGGVTGGIGLALNIGGGLEVGAGFDYFHGVNENIGYLFAGTLEWRFGK